MVITSRAELDATRGEDFILCLICHRHFKFLAGTHLARVHGLTPVEYKKAFNIPANFGLACNSYRRDLAERAKGKLVTPDGLSSGLIALGQTGRKRHPKWLREEAGERRRCLNAMHDTAWYVANGKRGNKNRSPTTGRFVKEEGPCKSS